MTIGYIKLPEQYYHELLSQGKGEKARCLLQFMMDTESNKKIGRKRKIKINDKWTETYQNSVGYYTESWGHHDRGKCIKPKSKGSVALWLKEFSHQLNKYNNGWDLINMANGQTPVNNPIKKPTERLLNGNCTVEPLLNPTVSEFKKTDCSPTERQLNEYKTLNDDDNNVRERLKKEREFDNLYFIFRNYNGSYTGNKSKGLLAYMQKDLDYKAISSSIHLYFLDSNVKKKCGIEKYFLNEVYQDYISKRISVYIEELDRWIDGSYLNEEFIADEGKKFIMTSNGFANWCIKGKVKILDLKDAG